MSSHSELNKQWREAVERDPDPIQSVKDSVLTEVFWSGEQEITVQNEQMKWTFPIEYPASHSTFAFSDGTLLQVTRNGGDPKIQVFEKGSSNTKSEGAIITFEDEIQWVIRAWGFANLRASNPH